MKKTIAPFSLKKRLESFKHAFAGLHILLREEHNARIHVFATIVVVVLGFLLKVSIAEWLTLMLTIALVIVVEILNSAIENLADAITEEYNINIKKAKDLGAAAVLVSAIIAIVVGLLVFVPKLILLF